MIIKVTKTKTISLNISRFKGPILLANLILALSFITTAASVFVAFKNFTQLNQPPPEVAPAQLLNKNQIQKATTLIQEQTINFTLEE